MRRRPDLALVSARAAGGTGLLRLIGQIARGYGLAIQIERADVGLAGESITLHVCPPGEEILAPVLRSQPGVLRVDVQPATVGRR